MQVAEHIGAEEVRESYSYCELTCFLSASTLQIIEVYEV